MEKLLTELRDRFSKAAEEAEASVGMIDDIMPDKADALRERIRKLRKDVDMSMSMICEELANTNGDNKETIACHVMLLVDSISGMERIPYLVQVYKYTA